MPGIALARSPDVHDPAAPGFESVPFLKAGAHPEPIVLTDVERNELARIGKRLRLSSHTVIYRERSAADSVFVVADGVLKSYRVLPRGKRVTSAFLFHHDVFGLAERGRYLNTVEAVTPVTLHQLPLVDLIPLIKTDARLQFKFLIKVTQKLRESQRRAIVVGRRDAVGRLAMFLMMMQAQRQLTLRSEREICLPMSRKDIADFLSLSSGAVSRAAKALERRGIATFDGRDARIIDALSLAKLAGAV